MLFSFTQLNTGWLNALFEGEQNESMKYIISADQNYKVSFVMSHISQLLIQILVF